MEEAALSSLSLDDAASLPPSSSTLPSVLCTTRLRFPREVTKLALNATASLAALAAKKALSVIGTAAPFAVAREISLPGKAAPTAAAFAPHTALSALLATSAGQCVYVYNLNDPRAPLQATLPHARNVRSFAWSLFDPNVMATCAADNAIHLWDLRDLKQPKAATTLKVFTSGISSVRWNKHNPNVLASSHDIQVEIWDLRRSAPVTFITAHPTKIATIDWSPTTESDLLTSSVDGSVKLWDIKRSRICQGSFQTGAPVVKAAYAPGGQSVMVLNSGQLHLRLWALDNLHEPAFVLSGNKDVCPDFAMCERVGSASRDVAAWSRDMHLCFWEVPSPSERAASAVAAAPPASSVSSSSSSVPSSPSARAHLARHSTPGKAAAAVATFSSLRDELDELEHSPLDGVTVESHIAALSRHAVVRTADAHGRPVVVKVAFPSLYPHNAAPSFEFLLPETQLPTDVMVALVASLTALCRRHTAQSQNCLRVALALLRKSVLSEDVILRRRAASFVASASPDVAAPVNVPCPRLSGASFSPSGRLVHFSNGLPFAVRTYKQLRDALAGVLTVQQQQLLLQQQLQRQQQPQGAAALEPVGGVGGADDVANANVIQPVVTHYHLPHVAPVVVQLALEYRLDGPVAETCAFNAQVALRHDARPVAAEWRSLAAITDAAEGGALPVQHALARGVVRHILGHFEASSDVQSVAVMSHVLMAPVVLRLSQRAASEASALLRKEKPKVRVDVSASAAAGAPPGGESKVWTKRLFQKVAKPRASSDAPVPSESVATAFLVSSPPATSGLAGPAVAATASAVAAGGGAAVAVARPAGDLDGCLIDPSLFARYLSLQQIYADLCLCFGLFTHRARLLLLSAPSATPARTGLSLQPTCPQCSRNAVDRRQCSHCNALLWGCAVCRLPVRGLFSVCALCGHGGHTASCMAEWFRNNDSCPMQGCACKCASRGDWNSANNN